MEFIINLILVFLAIGLFFWLVIILSGVIMAWYVKRRVKKFHRNIEEQFAAQSAAGNPYRTAQTSDGISVEDRRTDEEASKKIFAPDEGEYVEFTED